MPWFEEYGRWPHSSAVTYSEAKSPPWPALYVQAGWQGAALSL